MATRGDSRTRQSQQAASDATSPQFSDALDAEERDRSSRPAARVNRPQVPRKPVTTDNAAQAAPQPQPSETDGRPAPKPGADAQQTKAGDSPAAGGKTDAPATAPADPDKKDEAKGAAPSPEQPQPVVQAPVPQLAPQPTAGPAEATISAAPTAGEEAIKAIAEATPAAGTAPAAGAQPAVADPKAAASHAEAAAAVAQVAAPAARPIGAGEAPAGQTAQVTDAKTAAQAATGGKAAEQPEKTAQQPATDGQKADVKAEAKPDFRSEASAAQTTAASQTASGSQTPDTQPAIPAPVSHTASSGPLSFVGDIAQKVAAQTQAPGSVVPVHAVAVAIAARASAGSTRFDIKLDPAELGRIEVSLTLDREGRVKSKIVAEKPETLELLQRDQRNLERTLNQAGLNTSEGSVEFSLKDQGQSGAERDQSQSGQRHWQGYVEGTEAQPAPQASAANYARLAAARGGVDIRI
jgi:flagellar hook-length control protein FliK